MYLSRILKYNKKESQTYTPDSFVCDPDKSYSQNDASLAGTLISLPSYGCTCCAHLPRLFCLLEKKLGQMSAVMVMAGISISLKRAVFHGWHQGLNLIYIEHCVRFFNDYLLHCLPCIYICTLSQPETDSQ